MCEELPSFEDFDPNFGHWLAGFIAGEGCFAISKNGAGSFHCEFSLNLRDDDRVILDEIQERTGIGVVLSLAASGTSRPQARWIIRNKQMCLALVDLLDRFSLRAKKGRDYAIWRQAVWSWNARGQEELNQYAEQLHEARTYISMEASG
jgi:hypothetical protein